MLAFTAIRGLLSRSRATVLIFLLTVAGTGAAAAGPAYYQAAKTSILHDAISKADFVGRGYEAAESGDVAGMRGPASSVVQQRLGALLGPLKHEHLFEPEVDSVESSFGIAPWGAVPIVYRTGFCAHLAFHGTCPTKVGQVLVSQPQIKVTHWRIGQRFRPPGWPTLVITGIYTVPDVRQLYWQTRGPTYFPAGSIQNAFFTPEATLENAPPQQQGSVMIDQILSPERTTTNSPAVLSAATNELAVDPLLGGYNIIVTSGIAATLHSVESQWHTVAVPVALITAQLLALCLLLLFTAVTEAVDGRGTDIALARLRGYGRIRTLGFGLSEPVLVLVAALPVGVLAGWEAATKLSAHQLRPGTPVVLPAFGWIGAAAVVAAGLAAVLVAAIRTVRRPVTEQWRRSGPQSTRRGWIVDAIFATASVAALADIVRGGQTGQGSGSTLGLLVPGLLGLTVAVAASRVLPVLCRAAFAPTQRRGGLGIYLALRHIARRPGGIRTTIVLATAFTLATYAIGAWFVGRANYNMVASRQLGAPVVLTVSTPAGQDIGAIVDRIDPGGQHAAGALRYTDLSGAKGVRNVLAVEPARFARVAFHGAGFPSSPALLTSELAPPAPAPIALTGDSIRVTVRADHGGGPQALLTANVDANGDVPVQLGALPAHGTATLTGSLVNCPCVLQDFDISNAGAQNYQPVSGSVTILGIQEHQGGAWKPVAPGVFDSPAAWAASGGSSTHTVTAGASGGLTWGFSAAKVRDAILLSVNHPDPLPAIVSPGFQVPGQPLVAASGLDGNATNFKVADTAEIPGMAAGGAVVDLKYAELAAGYYFPAADQQVLVTAAARPDIEQKLRAAHVKILSVRSTAALAAEFARQGPGLTSILFLADAAAAVLLASGTAVLGLYISARRRRYEYAALEASGVARRAVRRSLLIEIVVVTAFGSITGIAAGVAALAIAIRGVPEFARSPGIPLNYHPPGGQLAMWLGICVAALLIAAGAAAIAIISGIRSEQLRESAA